MTAADHEHHVFKRAVVYSAVAHIILFLLLILSPYFPKPSQKGTVYYVNMVGFGGGAGGGDVLRGGRGAPEGGEEVVETAPQAPQSLADLTPPQKFEQESQPSLRYPVEKPKREPEPKVEKKSVIQKSDSAKKAPPEKKESGSSGKGEGTGSGVRLGFGSGSGSGFGSEFASQIGLGTFPFPYYLETILDTVSSNWFTSRLSAGVSGEFYTTVYFRIQRDGRISNVSILERSGVTALDLSAVRAVQSSRFPPLPSEYREDYLGIRLIFEHK